MNIETLQKNIVRLRNELDELNQLGELTQEGIDRRNQVQNDLSQAEYDLAQLEKEQVRAEQIEEKVEAEGIPFAVDGVDFTDLDKEVIALVNAIVKADRRRIYAEHAIEVEQLEEEARLNGNTIEELRTQVDEFKVENQQLQRELSDEQRLRTDAEAKRDAAVAQAEEINREIEALKAEVRRLESQVEDYQKAKVWGERQAQQLIETNTDEKDEIKAALEALKKKKYARTEDWGSVIKVEKPEGGFELVKRAELEAEWEPVTVPNIDGGSDTQDSFRGKDSQADTGDDQVSASEGVTVPAEVIFRVESPNVSLSDNESVNGEMAVQTAEPRVGETESFEQEVRRRLGQLERSVFGAQQGAA